MNYVYSNNNEYSSFLDIIKEAVEDATAKLISQHNPVPTATSLSWRTERYFAFMKVEKLLRKLNANVTGLMPISRWLASTWSG